VGLSCNDPPRFTRQPVASGTRHGTGRMSDIKHVVLLMQENGSFDHYFGAGQA
jgi:phospholipase C